MSDFNRRHLLRSGIACTIPMGFVTLMNGCQQSNSEQLAQTPPNDETDSITEDPDTVLKEEAMKVHYLEIVTPEAEAVSDQYSKVHGVTFSEPDKNLGNARTAKLDDGSMIGIRAPMHDGEKPVVRPYILVEDIKAALDAAEAAGAKVALPPMPIPEHGTCAIVIHGGIDCGFWQL